MSPKRIRSGAAPADARRRAGAALLAAALAACTGEDGPPGSPDPAAGGAPGTGGAVTGSGGVREPFDLPPCEPTFASIRETVFRPTCDGEYCHGFQSPAWNLYLLQPQTLSYLLSYPAASCPDYPLVAPGDPGRSYLYLKVSREDPPCKTERMPRGLKKLPDHSIACIEGWIRDLGGDGGKAD